MPKFLSAITKWLFHSTSQPPAVPDEFAPVTEEELLQALKYYGDLQRSRASNQDLNVKR